MYCIYNTVFLGGSIKNDYRERITPIIEDWIKSWEVDISIFNPVVDNWTDAHRRYENTLKANKSVFLVFYLCADPDGIFRSNYSLEEIEWALRNAKERTIVIFDYEGMSSKEEKRHREIYFDLLERFPDAQLHESLESALPHLFLGLEPLSKSA